jgi:hypothetical protein
LGRAACRAVGKEGREIKKKKKLVSDGNGGRRKKNDNYGCSAGEIAESRDVFASISSITM